MKWEENCFNLPASYSLIWINWSLCHGQGILRSRARFKQQLQQFSSFVFSINRIDKRVEKKRFERRRATNPPKKWKEKRLLIAASYTEIWEWYFRVLHTSFGGSRRFQKNVSRFFELWICRLQTNRYSTTNTVRNNLKIFISISRKKRNHFLSCPSLV